MKFEQVKTFLTISFVVLSATLWAQRDYVYGFVYDTSSVPISDVYIRNISSGSITSTNEDGEFRIPAALGDSLTLSYIGYESISVVVEEAWVRKESVVFQLKSKITFLDEVTVTKFPEYQQFKEQILSTDAEDTSFLVYGVPDVVITREDRLNTSLKSRGPISLLHNTFSKRAKEQKKMRKVLQAQGTQAKVRTKFNREWVADLTKLEGDRLTSFIAYCNFSDTYILTTPEYLIQEDMMALLPRFLETYDPKG